MRKLLHPQTRQGSQAPREILTAAWDSNTRAATPQPPLGVHGKASWDGHSHLQMPDSPWACAPSRHQQLTGQAGREAPGKHWCTRWAPLTPQARGYRSCPGLSSDSFCSSTTHPKKVLTGCRKGGAVTQSPWSQGLSGFQGGLTTSGAGSCSPSALSWGLVPQPDPGTCSTSPWIRSPEGRGRGQAGPGLGVLQPRPRAPPESPSRQACFLVNLRLLPSASFSVSFPGEELTPVQLPPTLPPRHSPRGSAPAKGVQLPSSLPHRGASPKTWSGWESAPGCCPQAGLTGRVTCPALGSLPVTPPLEPLL